MDYIPLFPTNNQCGKPQALSSERLTTADANLLASEDDRHAKRPPPHGLWFRVYSSSFAEGAHVIQTDNLRSRLETGIPCKTTAAIASEPVIQPLATL